MRRFLIALLLILFATPAFAALTGTFSAIEQTSPVMSFAPGETASFTLAGTFTGTVVLERSKFLDAGFVQVTSTTGTTEVTAKNDSTQTYFYRLRCTVLGEAETIDYSLDEDTGQVFTFFEDSEGVDRLKIIDGGVGVVGTFDVTGATTLDAVELSGLSLSATALTTSGAIPSTASFVTLNRTTPLIAATIAAPEPGRLLVITQIDAGTVGHTVALSAGTFDGTNTLATFNAQNETLVLFGVSATRFVILENIGAVALSAP